MRAIVPLALGLALSACAPTPHPAPAIKVVTVETKIPVGVPCVAASDVPAEPPKVGAQLNGNADHDIDLVSASAIRLRATLRTALALLSACTK